jgi:hypothetical protein
MLMLMLLQSQSQYPGHFSSGFNPGIWNCNPGTQKPDFKEMLLEIAQISSIIAKSTHFLA